VMCNAKVLIDEQASSIDVLEARVRDTVNTYMLHNELAVLSRPCGAANKKNTDKALQRYPFK